MQSLLVLLALGRLASGTDQRTCGFASCHALKEGMLNVHIVPHSHDDVGWLKTVDEYYNGDKSYIQPANVSRILDSVFEQLMADPDRRFIQVETAFLWIWWQQQNETTRDQYRHLVRTGRVQMAGGGWSMPDEATTHYQSLIDNFSWGFKFLNDTFGPCGVPDVGWQIDPFGHSRETAAIMAAMGFQGTFLGRLDYQDYGLRKNLSNLEVLWRASDHLGAEANIFTSALYDEYGPPPHCCWDVRCRDPDISDGNSESITRSFMTYVNEKAKHFKTNNVMITMGSDFTYMDAKRYYTNTDKLIKLVNARQADGGAMHLVYSTPSCYLKAVNDARPVVATKHDDFLPYASEPAAYWTGYYSSRPTLKYMERLGNNYLQVCKQLSALAGLRPASLDALRREMGIMQHHDAITGTEKEAVANDYALRLSSAIAGSAQLAREALGVLLGGNSSSSAELKSCLLLNISQCDVSEQNDDFVVTVYNPLSRPVSHYVRLPVKNGTYSVTDHAGVSQRVQTLPIPSPVLRLAGRQSEAWQELVFRAVDLPPLGLRNYRVSRTSSVGSVHQPVNSSFIGNTLLTLHVESDTGLLAKMVVNGSEVVVEQNLYYYDAYVGLNGGSGTRTNGAYVFKPKTNTPTPFADKATFSIYKGELVEEIQQQFNDWASQVIRVYKGEEHAEFEWLVGPIQMSGSGTQPISRFSSALRSTGEFHTDSNGRELLRRRRGYRASWNVNITQPVAGSYYPVTSRIAIKDEKAGLEMAVLTDRAQGGSSLQDGQIELMLHRRLGKDDGLGVAESLNDTQPARGRHYLVLGQASLGAGQRLLALRKQLQPWLFLSSTADWPADCKHQYAGLRSALPDSVHLLTLEPWGDDTVLLRLEHIAGTGDDGQPYGSVTVDLEAMFAPLAIGWARETTLDGTQWLSDVARLSWNTTDGSDTASARLNPVGLAVSLRPTQIRTFVVRLG
ncbi:lysosomal alpha-mannosidase-like [Bacillus rossius redtenbacheri]|uniref:lysosomal alpha-mannosidase-like n=1 Tax=Bacillus rossius redtenbacheri TaxID=93214 RepID=UPI002FDDE1D3